VVAPSRAHVALFVALCCLRVTDSAASRATDLDAGEVCIDPGWAGSELDELIVAAVKILRQSGHDPEDYRLELRMERPPGTGFADHRVQSYPSVVFYPEDVNESYPLRVDQRYPCSVSWVWRPHRFNAWQRRVIARSREILRDARPGGQGEKLAGVDVVETAVEVTVRLSLGDLDESGRAPSRVEVTLQKSDLSALD
jgi:hypothetical protein